MAKASASDSNTPETGASAAPAVPPAAPAPAPAPDTGAVSVTVATPVPPDLDGEGYEKRGRWVEKRSGEVFRRKVSAVPNDQGNTHFAKSETHYWEGSADAFDDEFRKQ